MVMDGREGCWENKEQEVEQERVASAWEQCEWVPPGM